MVTQLIDSPLAALGLDETDEMREIYQAQEILYRAQPAIVQRMLELQARLISNALETHQAPLRFSLPDQVIGEAGRGKQVMQVPTDLREQKIGGLMDSLNISDLKQRLLELENMTDQAVSTGAKLLRHAIASFLVHGKLPKGRRVDTPVQDGETISAYARRFFLPQWIAFDEQDNLLVKSIEEAEADITAIQNYLVTLEGAAILAPYMVGDREYHRLWNGMVDQLSDQGCAYARFKTNEMIRIIQRRAASNNLNRGLSLSLPYFDHKFLEIRFREVQVIPVGRVQFVPAFVVIASRMEQIKVEHDPDLDSITRKQLLAELKSLEIAFEHNTGFAH